MDSDDEESEGSGAPTGELIKSYLAYVVRALRGHRMLCALTTIGIALVTIVAVVVWPRSYTCVTVVAAQDSHNLDGDRMGGSLGGANEVITSSDNVAAIVDELQLVKTWETTLPPLSRFKQRLRTMIKGAVSDAAKREALIGMVQSAIYVQPPGWNESKLIISAEWGDAQTAAKLADAADQSFLRARHVAEISTITEYITILEGHANELREEIQNMASQGKVDEAQKAAKPAAPAAAAAPSPAAPRAYVAPSKPAVPAEDLTELRAQVAEKQQAVKAIEADRARRLDNAEQTLTELRTKFTSAHPMVAMAERNVAELQQDSPALVSARAELKDLSDKLKAKSAIQQEEAAFRGPGRAVAAGAAGATPGASSVEPLPADIMRLLQDDNQELDPTVSAQFRTAVNKFATLRDKIGTARVDLDTAQAAFKHRYQIVIPAEPPAQPSKPKIPIILGAGLFLSLVLGALATVIAELRTGKVVERWQVDMLGVPLLGDIRWPPAPGA